MENNKTPKIRFKGFTDPWEQRKVLDLLELLTDYDANGSFADMAKNVNTTDGDGYAWYVRITDLENPKPLSELKYVDESSYEFLKKTELHGGELLMAKRGDIGKVYIFEPRTKYATVAPNMYLLKLNNKVIPHFLYDYFVSGEGNKKLTRLNASSTMGALYKDDVKNIDVIMPSIEEQAMIGNFFQSIDHFITLHQRKYNKLLNVKKSMLEKMFPKNGSNIPEIRFKGFTDPWEQRKLGDILISLQNNTLSRANLSNEAGVAKNVHYGDVLIKFGEVLDVSKEKLPMISDESVLSKYKSSFLQNGDVIVADTAEDSTVGKCSEIAGLNDEVVLSGLHTIPYRPTEKFASGYLGYYLNSSAYHNHLIPLMQGIKVTSISKSAMQDTDIVYPKSVEEQGKIGDYFQSLDHLITLHQRELEKLQNIKKSMLEKMFV